MADLNLLPKADSPSGVPVLAVRVGVAALFFSLGLDKFPSNPGSHWVVVFEQIHTGQWFRYFAGMVECAAALSVLIPRTAVFGLLVLTCTMLSASLIVAFVLQQPGEASFPGFLFLVLAAISWFVGNARGSVATPKPDHDQC